MTVPPDTPLARPGAITDRLGLHGVGETGAVGSGYLLTHLFMHKQQKNDYCGGDISPERHLGNDLMASSPPLPPPGANASLRFSRSCSL